ncbi:YitT family protein [Atopobacter sp. AH10]|uniref:YitT family protein n=1 Tax=Atopobacter sp. AH10 TaxID=2315861 RepID=UPI0013146F0A|nr:YitT family protein [Atopobacter sp. AH10]
MSRWFAPQKLMNYAYMLGGTMLIAVGINSFFVPFSLVAGGMNGVSILLYRLFAISPDVSLFWSNFPLLLMSYFFIGKRYTLNTIVCSFLLPVCVRLMQAFPVYSGDPMLAALFGGIIAGLGIGLVFRGGSSTGGTGIPIQILHDYLKIPYGLGVIIVDGSVLMSAFIFLDFTTGLYSLIALACVSKAVDYVQTGGVSAKTCFIISNKSASLIDSLVKKDFGVTIVESRGAYSQEDKQMLVCTCPQKRVSELKETLKAEDKAAFCVIFDTKEVVGNRWESLDADSK